MNIRKNTLAVALILGACSCQNTIDSDLNHSKPKSGTTQKQQNEIYLRTPDEAKQALSEFLSQNRELRSMNGTVRDIKEVLDLSQDKGLRAYKFLSEFADSFYVITFTGNQGYAVVSKDKRCFPIYAILDSGAFESQKLRSIDMSQNILNMVNGAKREVKMYNQAVEKLGSQASLRGNTGKASENTENAKQNMLNEGWKISRSTPIRTYTTWKQRIARKGFYIKEQGVSYKDAYSPENKKIHDSLRSSASETNVFGCTPVAFGQVMYALKDFPGFKTLTYSNGESVLWDEMNPFNSLNIENQRFLGWITANCSPSYFDAGTMVLNIDATKFLRAKLGDYFASRYDNCTVAEGDFDGYGWAEDRKVAEDFFNHPHAFVIMTASSGALNYVSYHTFVIDGMIEFKKRIEDSGWFGWGWFSNWHDGIRHLYHVNAGWGGLSNGYYLYVQNVDDEFEYTGSNDAMDYRSKPSYLILWPSSEN